VKHWIIGLLVVSMCSTAMAGSLVLSEKDKSALQSVGISANDKMITELNDQEQAKFRSVLDSKSGVQTPSGENPALEAKRFLVTRYALRKMKVRAADKSHTQDISNYFTGAELREIEKYSMYYFAESLSEQLLLLEVRKVAEAQKAKEAPSSPLLFDGSSALSEKDKSALRSVGISPDDKMISELNIEEQGKFRSVLDSMSKSPTSPSGENPALEAKRFLVTRYALRKQEKGGLQAFTPAEIQLIKEHARYDYCYNTGEQLRLLSLLYKPK
jgi:ribosomal protein L20